jgi:transposase
VLHFRRGFWLLIPGEEFIHDIPEADKICPHDGHVLEVIGSDDHEQLDINPAQLNVLRLAA